MPDAAVGLSHSTLVCDIGSPHPLGPSWQSAQACWNFAVYAPDASSLSLCLFCPDTEEPLTEIKFAGRTGEIWHLAVRGMPAGTLYLLRAIGPELPAQGLTFANHLLLDPYVRQLNRALVFNERLYQQQSHYMLAKGVLQQGEFDWQGTVKPVIPREKTIVYEAHVKGLTRLHPEIPEHLRGTYLGVAQPVVLDHLQALGITTLQLLPVAAFMTEPRLEKMHLSNYWGYNPVCFMAPDPRYQVEDAVTEFKTLVRACHQRGIEVILDVVFNHTAEADWLNLSLRGLANRQYYLFESHADMTDYQQYCNFSGCGNTLNVAHPVCQKLVLDSLRYWLTEMQVDGFRFDLAVTLAREHKRFNPYATFLQIIAQDPVLSAAKLIAEPWDIGPYGYQLGQFPSHWSELNDKFRDTVRAFWRGDHGSLNEFTTRLLGSRDIFQKHHKPAVCSVNYLAYHDGFTLHDLVCYQHKHNWQNGEQNRDGHDHNLSCNHGIEGPTSDAAILASRYQHKRNLVATLLLSQGMVHWLAGDELSNSQQGNNNAYCQDNELSWLNWQLDYHQTQFLSFVQQMVRIRQAYPCLQQLSLLDDQYQLHGDKHKIHWYNPDGSEKTGSDWLASQRLSCCFVIQALSGEQQVSEQVLLLINAAADTLTQQLPAGDWYCMMDTAVGMGLVSPLTQGRATTQAAQSMSLWVSHQRTLLTD